MRILKVVILTGELRKYPMDCQDVNPGVIHAPKREPRIMRYELNEIFMSPRPSLPGVAHRGCRERRLGFQHRKSRRVGWSFDMCQP